MLSILYISIFNKQKIRLQFRDLGKPSVWGELSELALRYIGLIGELIHDAGHAKSLRPCDSPWERYPHAAIPAIGQSITMSAGADA